MEKAMQERILSCMADVLNQNGFRAELLRQGEENPLMLRCENRAMGKVKKDVTIECCFIPIAMPSEETGLLQFFVTLFGSVPEMYAEQTKRACEYCNDFSALGSFGFFPDAGQIYLKHNTLLDSSVDFEKVITFVADNISLLVASVGRFIDGLATVGFTGMPLRAAIDQELFPQMG